ALLPTAMKPVKAILCEGFSGNDLIILYLLEIALVIAFDLTQRVAAELFEKRIGQLKRDHRFSNHGGRRRGAYIRTLNGSIRRLFGTQVDRMQRAHEGRDRFHRYANDQWRAVGHA